MRASDILEVLDVRDHNLEYYKERVLAHKIGIKINNKWHEKLTEQEQRALLWYRDAGYEAINRSLRGESLVNLQPYVLDPAEQMKAYKFTITIEEAISLLDSAIAKCSFSQEVAVYRGHRDKTATAHRIAKMRVGASFTDPSFVSTTLHAQFAYTGYAHHGTQVVMRILISPGVPAAYISTEDVTEAEVLLGRGRTFTLMQRQQVAPVAPHLPRYQMHTFQAS